MVNKRRRSGKRNSNCKGSGLKSERYILQEDRQVAMANQNEFLENFDIVATASFILRNRFQRVALQFPDELLRHSVAIAVALKKELGKQHEEPECAPVRLFVMADTTFGSCCADEVAAMHADAQCIVHYGNACLSLTSRLPVWFVFGRAAVDVEKCATQIQEFAVTKSKPLLVMFGLEYSHEILNIRQRLSIDENKEIDVTFADAPTQYMKPSLSVYKCDKEFECSNAAAGSREQEIPHAAGRTNEQGQEISSTDADRVGYDLRGTCSNSSEASGSSGHPVSDERNSAAAGASRHTLGGLKWTVPTDRTMEDYIILWIGDECPGLTNVSLVFNTSTVVRYDCSDKRIVEDVANQSKVLKRRYYLVERAKDANVVGIVVGTLGVAGYADTIQNTRRMVESAGKKAYTLVMGKPNPAKLANFPECDVFVLVACPQTALVDSKEYLAPLLTPFEAELAFIEGRQWTGAYRLEFDNLEPSPSSEMPLEPQSEARFSFFTGGYVGSDKPPTKDREGGPLGAEDQSSRAVVLSKSADHARQLSNSSSSLSSTERSRLDIKSGAEYLAARTYQGLELNEGKVRESSAVPGREGRAAGYSDETTT